MIFDVNDYSVNIIAYFVANSTATGGLFNFFFVDESDGSIDIRKSYSMEVHRSNISNGIMLPLDLWPGLYRVYVYDIESNQRLTDGLNYQAKDKSYRVTNRGMIVFVCCMGPECDEHSGSALCH